MSVNIGHSAGYSRASEMNHYSYLQPFHALPWALGLVLVGTMGPVAGCTAAAVPDVHGFQQGSSSSGGSGGSSGGSQSSSGAFSSSGCGACAPGDDATAPPDDGGGTPSGDDGSTASQDSPSTPPPGVDSGNPFVFMFPEGGLSSSSSGGSSDGGANSCTSKICIDPVFDCPLQGCFNGCMNFHCM